MVKVCAIYQIKNSKNRKVYIGGTKDVERRFSYHKSRLKNGKHDNYHLQNAWNKYGEDSFVFLVIEICNEDNIAEREQHYIDETGCLERAKGYNIAPTANLPPMNEATKRKIGESNKGKPSWIKGKHHADSTKDKIRVAVLKNSKMRGKVGDQHHFFGKRHTDETKVKMSESKIGKLNNKSSKPIVQKKDGVFQTIFPSAMEAQRVTSVQAKNIAKCLKGQRKKAGGYEWEYYNEVVS